MVVIQGRTRVQAKGHAIFNVIKNYHLAYLGVFARYVHVYVCVSVSVCAPTYPHSYQQKQITLFLVPGMATAAAADHIMIHLHYPAYHKPTMMSSHAKFEY